MATKKPIDPYREVGMHQPVMRVVLPAKRTHDHPTGDLATIEEEAAGTRPEAVRHYQSLSVECRQRAAAIAELERLPELPGQTMGQLTEATGRVLEAVVTIDREALVRRVRESDELDHLRSRFERLRMMANTHAAEIDEWSRRIGHPLRVPRIVFRWPPTVAWDALLGAPAEVPELIRNDDPKSPEV